MHLSMESIAARLFGLALLHRFTAKQFERPSHRFPWHSGVLRFPAEAEVVFGSWAIVLVATMTFVAGGAGAIAHADSRDQAAPLFVLVAAMVMAMAASKPVLQTIGRPLGRPHPGSLIEGITDPAKYMPAGGGRWTHRIAITNAPAPAGVSLLKNGFRDRTTRMGAQWMGALVPTAIAAAALLFL